jgi:prophage tail gpP-like protein
MSAAHGIPSRGAPPGAADVLALIIAGQQWIGWQRVAVTRSMDTVPASFDIQVTERYPTTGDVSIKPGDACQVKIGGDLVITGYVDRYAAAVTGTDHTVRIAGRSKSQDLVDCSAFIGDKGDPSFQVKGGTALSIAQQLARPYDVEISSIAGPGAQIPQFNINLGETAWEIIDRITRYSKLIAYDLPDGSVVMAQAGTETMASGVQEGENVEQASVSFSLDQRYSDYEGHLLSTGVFGNDTGQAATRVGQVVNDAGVPRFRKRYIISEQSQMGHFLAHDRSIWECNRRAGRSQAVNVTCDAWRDAAGALWSPNHLTPIRLPALKLPDENWLIAQVSYTRDETGQHALLVLMPKEAFSPEPVAFQPLPVLVQDVERFNATKP